MWFQQILREETGCATYLVGSSETAQCAVFDPLWDIEPYVKAARKQGAKITHVIDSHAHADHVSGARRLAAAAGATLYLPDGMDASYDTSRLKHGDKLRLGEVELEAVHAPGHRPELINLLVRDLSRGSDPWCMLTADFLHVGDVARPDLAQDGKDGATTMFRETLPRLMALPDFVEVYPGHVSGSTCGRVTSGKAATTVGYERRFNPALRFEIERDFITFMTHDQPMRPANMGNIVAINQGKRPFTTSEPEPKRLAPAEAAEAARGGAILLDVRGGDAVAAGHIAGSLSVPMAHGSFEQWVGWILPPEGEVILAVEEAADAARAARKLAFVGLDSRVRSFVAIPEWREAGLPLVDLAQIEVVAFEKRIAAEGIPVLDVRDDSEWNGGHIASAAHRSFKQLPQTLDGLPVTKDQEVGVICGSGLRSVIACSILRRAGFTRLVNVKGGMAAWHRAGLPTTTP